MNPRQFIDSATIPQDWDIQRLSYGFRDIGSGTTPDTGNDSYYDGEIPWVTTSELRENRITETGKTVTQTALAEHSSLKLYPPGTLLIAMYGATIGRLGILGVEACTNQACCALAEPQDLHSKYIFYWLQAYQNDIIGLSRGGGQKNIGQEVIKSLRVSVPDTSTQSQIAEFLNHRTARIDALVEKQTRLLDLLDEKRQAVITRAVTAGLDSTVATKPTDVEWLGEIPEHWGVSRLKYLRDPFIPIVYGIILPGPDQDNGVPIIKGGDCETGELDPETLSKTTPEKAAEYQRSRLQAGDLVYEIRGSVGRVVEIPPELEGANLTQDEPVQETSIGKSDSTDSGFT